MHLPENRVAGLAKRVGIGEAALAEVPTSMRVTLGSCVGLCFFDGERGLYGLAHVLLPAPADGVIGLRDDPARFATTAVPHLIESMEIPPHKRKRLQVFVAGGASMYETSDPAATVGSKNVEAALESLREHRLHVKAQDTGGSVGRQLVVDGNSLRVLSLRLGEDDHVTTWDLSLRIDDVRRR